MNGRHPGADEAAGDGNHCLRNRIIATPGLAGLAGATFIPLALVLPRLRALPYTVAAVACPFLVCFAAEHRYLDHEKQAHRHESSIVQSQHEMSLGWQRQHKLWDLLDWPGSNNVRVLSAAAGLILARRPKFVALKGQPSHRRLNLVSGWGRWIGQACIFAGIGELGQQAYNISQDADPVAWTSNRKISIKDLIEAGRNGRLGEMIQKHKIGVTEDPASRRPDPNSLALTTADIAKQLQQGINIIEVNTRDGPHHAVSEPGETELKPAPHTNYDWMVPAARVVPELEHHITKLRAHRAKLTAEAKVIWRWLAEKEVEYYRLRDSATAVGYDAEQTKNQLRAYCETLANEHVTLWIAVSKIDWIIADSQKRIAQHQQLSKNENVALDQIAPRAPSSNLSFALDRLHSQADQLEDAIEKHTQTIAKLESDLKNSVVPDMPEPLRSQLKAASKRDQQRILRGTIEGGKTVRQDQVTQKAVVDDILRDSEAKASRND